MHVAPSPPRYLRPQMIYLHATYIPGDLSLIDGTGTTKGPAIWCYPPASLCTSAGNLRDSDAGSQRIRSILGASARRTKHTDRQALANRVVGFTGPR